MLPCQSAYYAFVTVQNLLNLFLFGKGLFFESSVLSPTTNNTKNSKLPKKEVKVESSKNQETKMEDNIVLTNLENSHISSQ